MRKADADAVDAAVGAGEDLKAKAVFYDDFAGERNVAGDLRDQPTKRSRFIVFRKRERRGVFSCVSQRAVVVPIGTVRIVIA